MCHHCNKCRLCSNIHTTQQCAAFDFTKAGLLLHPNNVLKTMVRPEPALQISFTLETLSTHGSESVNMRCLSNSC